MDLLVPKSAVREATPAEARVRAWWHDRWLLAGGAALGALLAATLLAQLRPLVLLPVLALGFWFIVPGVVLARRVAATTAVGIGWVLAPAWGYLLSSLVLLGLWAVGQQGLLALVVAPVGGIALAWPFGALLRDRLDVPAWTRSDTRALLVLLAIVPLVVGWPFARVGAFTDEGQVFRAYFTADFVWAMAAVAEVAKGALPPVNPFRAGAAMHYYWLPHLFSAAEFRHFGSVLALRELLLVNATLSGLAFVSFLYGLARQFTPRAWAAAIGVAVAILATSFEGLQQLVVLWTWDRPLSLVRYLNIEAITRWMYGGLPVDGLQRLLLYQPQHQLGYATAFSALLVAMRARRAASWRLALFCGAMLGGSFLLSTFSALMLTVIVAAYLLVRVVRERGWAQVPLMALAGAAPLAVALALTRLLQYVDAGPSPVQLRVNAAALTAVGTTLSLGFGPFLLALAAASYLYARRPELRQTAWPVAVVTLACAFFYVFVDVRDHQNVYVAWRVGHVLFITMAGLLALVLTSIGGAPAWRRRAAAGLVALVVAAALPTTAIDLYNTQDITNFQPGPGFPWTLLLTSDEVAALEWVRTRTEPDAIVQVDAAARDVATWAYIPAFAERRMAAGLPISMIPLAGYQAATDRVGALFGLTTAADVAFACRKYQVDFLYLGPPEQARHPHLRGMLDAAPEFFEKVFERPTVVVYHLRDARRGRRSR